MDREGREEAPCLEAPRAQRTLAHPLPSLTGTTSRGQHCRCHLPLTLTLPSWSAMEGGFTHHLLGAGETEFPELKLTHMEVSCAQPGPSFAGDEVPRSLLAITMGAQASSWEHGLDLGCQPPPDPSSKEPCFRQQFIP